VQLLPEGQSVPFQHTAETGELSIALSDAKAELIVEWDDAV